MTDAKPVYKIVKTGGSAPVQVAAKRTQKTYPKSSLRTTRKVSGVTDPAKPPPFRKGTLRILTEAGRKKREKTIRRTVRSLSDSQARERLRKAGIGVSSKAPPHLVKEILDGGMVAGMIPA